MNEQAEYGSEDAWTARLADLLKRTRAVRVGIGDDAAVVQLPGPGQELVYTTDAVIESIHFHPGTAPERIGRKMAGRLLSDLAAMGAVPDHVLFNLVVPAHTAVGFLDGLYRGAASLLDQHQCAIVGGDTVAGTPLALHGFASGHLPSGTAVLRSGARAGDVIFVTGELGGSSGGRHLDFEPRVREGIWLREHGWATAMMDLSDGLSRDLPRLCRASGVGALLDAARIPARHGLERALSEGEDYELLFTVPAGRRDHFEAAWRTFSGLSCSAIGAITAEAGILRLLAQDGTCKALPEKGFDHFA